MKNIQFQYEIIDVLNDNSPEFRKFYSDNKKTLAELEISKFEKFSENKCIQCHDKTFEIRLKEIPPTTNTAFVVAHELYHAILWKQRYPNLMTKDSRCKGIMTLINSMVYDQFINEKLKKYFDDGCQQIKSKSKNYFQNNLKGRDNIGDKSETIIVFFYVNLRLNFEILCSTADIQESEYFYWFEDKRPDLITKSNELISLIQSTNMNNLENTENLFQAIKKRYPILEPINTIIIAK
jgi:hypothetical protein